MTLKQKRVAFYLVLLSLPIWMLIGANLYIEWGFNSLIYSSPAAVPPRPVALVLGTAREFQGFRNPYYQYRIEAAAQLYHSGKIKGILISGDNSSEYYNEPGDMQKDLMKRGVPEAYINLDYAGFRTLDSIVRAEKVFGVTNYIVVSQRFHCQRALFLARIKGHQAVAFEAQDIPTQLGGYSVKLREVGARAKALWDVVVFQGPKFYGPRVPLRLKP